MFEHGFSHVINSLYYIGILKLCQSNTYMKEYPRVASHNLRTHQVNFFFQVLRIPIFSTLLAPLLFVVCGCRQFVIIFHFLLWTKCHKREFWIRLKSKVILKQKVAWNEIINYCQQLKNNILLTDMLLNIRTANSNSNRSF